MQLNRSAQKMRVNKALVNLKSNGSKTKVTRTRIITYARFEAVSETIKADECRPNTGEGNAALTTVAIKLKLPKDNSYMDASVSLQPN